MEISVARALTELKTLDSRIENKISNSKFVAGVKISSDKVSTTHSRDEFEKEAISTYDSIVALIERRKAIKTAIVNSNALTKVMIADKEYTVADAIERKNSIQLDKELLAHMSRQFNGANVTVERNNELVETNLHRLIEQSVGADKKTSAVDTTAFSEAYRKNNCFELVNPLKVQDRIETLRKEIEDFETDVDSILTESNVLTKIVIPD